MNNLKPLNNFQIKDLSSFLLCEQTWGVSKKIFDIFIENLKKRIPTIEFQKFLPNSLSRIAKYYLVSQYWYFFSSIYGHEKYEDSFFYFLDKNKLTIKNVNHPRISKLAYYYLNKIRVVK